MQVIREKYDDKETLGSVVQVMLWNFIKYSVFLVKRTNRRGTVFFILFEMCFFWQKSLVTSLCTRPHLLWRDIQHMYVYLDVMQRLWISLPSFLKILPPSCISNIPRRFKRKLHFTRLCIFPFSTWALLKSNVPFQCEKREQARKVKTTKKTLKLLKTFYCLHQSKKIVTHVMDCPLRGFCCVSKL